MQIKGLFNGIQTYEQSQADKAKQAEKKGAKNQSQSTDSEKDRVTLSQGAKLFQTATQEAANSSEVRAEKVQALKEQVDNGSYQPDSQKTAEKMIREDMENWFGWRGNE